MDKATLMVDISSSGLPHLSVIVTSDLDGSGINNLVKENFRLILHQRSANGGIAGAGVEINTIATGDEGLYHLFVKEWVLGPLQAGHYFMSIQLIDISDNRKQKGRTIVSFTRE